MQLPSMKASDDEEDEQKHVVAPLHTAEGEEADDDEEEEQDKADTSKNSQDGDQGHGVVPFCNGFIDRQVLIES